MTYIAWIGPINLGQKVAKDGKWLVQAGGKNIRNIHGNLW